MLLYIDPGAGSMVIQAILAGLLAVPFMFRSAIGRFVARFRGHGSPDPVEKPAGPDAD
jgi:hypothetical protein